MNTPTSHHRTAASTDAGSTEHASATEHADAPDLVSEAAQASAAAHAGAAEIPGWQTIALEGHECELFVPRQLNPHGAGLLYLHGVRQAPLADQHAFTTQFERLGWPVLGPRTGRSWWSERICPEFDPERSAQSYLLDVAVPYMQSRFGCSAPRLALLGVSMGGQGVLRLAFRYPERFPVVAAIAPAIDFYQHFDADDDLGLPTIYDDAESARQDSATLHIHPLNWPRNTWFCCDPADEDWLESSERLRMKLYSLGVPHECDLETSAGGHSWDYFGHMASRAVEFIAQRLESERLRLV